jgi:NAD(P)H-flavin reductase
VQLSTSPMALLNAYNISPHVRHFVFSVAVPKFTYLPGQFITIHFDKEGKSLKRSYSIANVPKQDNCIEFAAGFVEGGPGTELLFNLKVGDKLQMTGPYGRLVLRDEVPGRYLLVATSTGVTPYRSMLDELSKRLAQHDKLQVVILLGVQKKEDILYAEEFQTFAQHDRVRFIPCLSRDKDSHYFLGHVQEAFDSLDLNPATDLVYLCGNPSMIDQSFIALQNKQFSVQQVIREKYISR